MNENCDQFRVSIPEDWDEKQDVEFVIDCVDHCDKQLLVETLVENCESLGRTLLHAIRFLLSQEESEQNEYLENLSVASRTEFLLRLIKENPPMRNNLERFEMDLANCVIAESEYNRILYKYAVNTEKLWLSELQMAADDLKAAECYLDESLWIEYRDYRDYGLNARR